MIDRLMTQIEQHYNPENDLPPHGIRVTYTDYALLSIIKLQQERIEQLESVVKRLVLKVRATDEFLLERRF